MAKHPDFTNANLIETFVLGPGNGGTVHLVDGKYWLNSFDHALDTSRKLGDKIEYKAWQRWHGFN